MTCADSTRPQTNEEDGWQSMNVLFNS
jgi:hypothetical protein